MKKTLALAALTLSGCAAIIQGNAPETIKTAYTQMYAAMRYDYQTEFRNGRDIATSGCPQTGDCEDVAFCLVEKLRQQGKQPAVEVFSWKSGKVAWTHVMAKSEGLLIDYYGIFKSPNERVELKEECEQVYTAEGKPAWSTAGAWLCYPKGNRSQTPRLWVVN